MSKAEKAAKRAEELMQRAGIKSPKSVAGAVASGASAYFQADARKEVARQEAEANKVKYQQQTHQVALQQNAGIMHELDKPMLRVEMNAGTAKKPIPLSIDLSLLGAYGLANLLVSIQQDTASIAAGNDPVHISTWWQDARTPRTEKFRNLVPPDDGGAASAATKAARTLALQRAYNAAKATPGLFGALRDKMMKDVLDQAAAEGITLQT